MLTPKEIELFGKFLPNPFAELTAKDFTSKSSSYTERALKHFEAEGLVHKQTVGNVRTYTCIISDQSVAYLTIAARERLRRPVQLALNILLEAIPKDAAVLVFGSHAKNTSRAESDLDMYVITPEPEQVKRLIADASRKTIIEIDAHIFTKEDTAEMLRRSEQNLAKEIVIGNLPTRNAILFYSLVALTRYAPPRTRR